MIFREIEGGGGALIVRNGDTKNLRYVFNIGG